MHKKVVIFSDGGARGNPGPAGIGAVISDGKTNEVVATVSKYIGSTTNNQAEYRALLAGLHKAKELGAEEVDCFLDSLLVVKQLKRVYRVKHPDIAVIYLEVWNFLSNFKKVRFHHIPREKNKHADTLVNEALDRMSADK